MVYLNMNEDNNNLITMKNKENYIIFLTIGFLRSQIVMSKKSSKSELRYLIFVLLFLQDQSSNSINGEQILVLSCHVTFLHLFKDHRCKNTSKWKIMSQ